MSIKIPKELKKEFHNGFNEYINSMGREVIAYLEATTVVCPNCTYDNIQKESNNIYNEDFKRPVNIFPGTSFQKTIYPVPFNVTSISGIQLDPTLIDPKILQTSLCPVCNGTGLLMHDNIVKFIGVVTIGKNDSPTFKDLAPGRDGIQFARIKTFNTNYSICRDAKYFIIDGIKYILEIPTRLKGLGDLHITELYLSEVQEGSSVNTSQDKDPRLLNIKQSNISNQADIGTPTIPPVIPGDDIW